MHMQAIRLHAPDDLRVEELPLPAIGAGEILLRTGAALICGTDLRMFRHGAKGLPLTLGHELAGTIAEVGAGVQGYHPGMRVAVAPNFGCGVCDACVSGNTQLCAGLAAIGVTMDGGFGEFVRIPQAAVTQGNVCPIGASVSFAAAAMAEPLSCVYNAFERSALRPGESVLVIGAGPIGLMHAKVYKMAGAGRVMINDVNAQRLAVCRQEDPFFIPVGPGSVKEQVLELTGGKGADVVVTAASAVSAQQAAFELAALNGRVIFFGGLPHDQRMVPLDTNIIHYKMITVTGTSRQSLRQYRLCLDLIGQGLVPVDSILTAKFGLDQAGCAFDHALRGEGLKTGFVMG